MRQYLLAAVAAAAIASPAIARDGSTYVGVEGGAMLVEDTKLNFHDVDTDLENPVAVDYGTGFDVDLIAGHDFGMIRAEAELAYKRAGVNEVVLGPGACTAIENCILDADGKGRALSAMANLLLDFGDESGINGYLGAGAGLATVKINADFSGEFPTIPETEFGFSDDDSAFAWQLIAGLRLPVSDNIDVGVKYRFFSTRALEFRDSTTDSELRGRWQSHSLLASLIYNFYSPPPPPPPAPPPPPPPPPPPATQTCPDGSVILATEACPVPPPPPPPPPPAPERG
jgi:opacity protein-like surface antigen